MIKIKLSIYIFLLFICTNCATYDPIGNYINKSGYVSTWISIKEDSTFIAYINGDVANDTVCGKWKKQGRKILLNENIYPATYSITECDTCAMYKLSIYDSKTKKILGAYFKVFSKDSLIREDYTGFRDSIVAIMPKADSIHIGGYPIEYFQHYKPINVKLPAYRVYIKVYLEERKIDYFATQMWIIKSDKMKAKCIQHCDDKKPHDMTLKGWRYFKKSISTYYKITDVDIR